MATVDVDTADLDPLRAAIVALAEAQERVVDALQAQNVRLDGVTEALLAVDNRLGAIVASVTDLTEAVTKRASGDGDDGGIAALTEQIARMSRSIDQLTVGTEAVSNGIARLGAQLTSQQKQPTP